MASDDIIATARQLLIAQDRAALATQYQDFPYASLVLTAPDADGAPLLLLSDLAEHSKNLKRDNRASLLLDGTLGMAQPLAGPRLTLLGHAELEPRRATLGRYLARHPEAADWAAMSDFRLYRLKPARAHLVAGFGRIAWIEAAVLFPITS